MIHRTSRFTGGIQRVLLSLLLLVLLQAGPLTAQTAWPSEGWTAAENLTGIMDSAGLTELSGLHWNPLSHRLYVAHGDGRVRVLQLNTTTNIFSQIANQLFNGGPEGITQADLSANEFYTVDEDNYQIRKYIHPPDFSTVTLSKHWNLLISPSPMTNTGNTGPEGIAFVPDSFLTAKGFIGQQTGSVYTSSKGMGGLIFIAHQDQGYVWVLDVNPNVNDDFIYVGKYKTNRTESCDLAFDRTTGLLYILHNTGSNTLEVTDLSSSVISGGRKFAVKKEFAIPNPTGNINIEGFAIAPIYGGNGFVSTFLCRDVESAENILYQKDCLRWFSPFSESGTSGIRIRSSDNEETTSVGLYPNPAKREFTVSFSDKENDNTTVKIFNSIGQTVIDRMAVVGERLTLNISPLAVGMYFVEVNRFGKMFRLKLIKI